MRNYLFFICFLFCLLTISCQKAKDRRALKSCCEIPALDETFGFANLYVPNVFTPNNNGINDAFIIHANAGVQQVAYLIIKNADGDIVFEKEEFPTNNSQEGWDGKTDGEEIIGVYDYELGVYNFSNEILEFNGQVCLRLRNDDNILPCVDFEDNCQWGTQYDSPNGYNGDFPSSENCQ